MTTIDLTPAEFVAIIKRDEKFVRGLTGGKRADLNFSNLANLRLPGLNLQAALLTGFNFSNTSLTAADLSFADLFCANLRGANLSGADLRPGALDPEKSRARC